MRKNATWPGVIDRKKRKKGSGLSIKKKRVLKKARQRQKWEKRSFIQDAQPRS